MPKKIKIALYAKQNRIKAFEYEIIETIINSDLFEMVLVVNQTNCLESQQSFLYKLYSKADGFIYGRGKNYLLPKSLKKLNIKTLDIETTSKSGREYVKDEDLSIIKKHEVDLIIKFADTVLKGEILSVAKYGIWEYSYGKRGTHSDFAGLWETLEGDLTIKTTLEKLPDTDNNGYTIDSFVGVCDELSAYNNKNLICWKTHMMLPRNLTRLAKNPEAFIKEKSQNLYFFKDKIDKCPSNLEMIKPVCKLLYKNIVSRLDRLFYKVQWSIFFAENETDYPFQRDMSKFKKINTPNAFFWADPFVIDKENKSYIFFEDYVYKTKKGHISVIEYNHDNKKLSEPTVVIDTDYHQSYPFIFEHENEIYMIPEGSKDKDVKLYKAVEFPYKWEVQRVLMKDIEAVDVTLFFNDGKWWLFTNIIDKSGQSLNEELYIYYCNDFLKDEWIAHEKNPIISDIRTSRPAGKIISYKGDLYRPSQNSAGGYGYSTNFNKIIELNAKEFKEEFVSEITPDFINGVKAIHTYNSSKKLTVVDGVCKIRRFFNP